MLHKACLALRIGFAMLACAAAHGGSGLPLFFVPAQGPAGAGSNMRCVRLISRPTSPRRRPASSSGGSGSRCIFPAPARAPGSRRWSACRAGSTTCWVSVRRTGKQTCPSTRRSPTAICIRASTWFIASRGRGLNRNSGWRPGADPAAIQWRYQGAGPARLDADGGLAVSVAGGQWREQKPVLYQEAGRRREPVQGAFRLAGGGQAGFTTGAYDRARTLIIDPVVSYSSYLGGSGADSARAIAVDAAGNAYIAGYTDSSNFPMAGPLQSRNAGGVDAFVAKLNAAGSALIYCTYLGGRWDDRAFGIGVDSAGNAYLSGWTYSVDFPTTSGARQRALGGGRDGFVAKLNPSGNALLYSTLLGGSGYDSANAIAVDAAGNAYVAGDTYSTNFPVLNAYQGSNRGRQDAFVSKLNPAGSALLWSTYLGGYGDEGASALTVDAAGNVYLTGGTTSTNFPTYHALQSANAGGQDAFVSAISAGGQTLVFSTYLGGSGGVVGANETGTAIQRDASGAVYVAGLTSSTNFPTAGAFQPAYGGGPVDGFVSKLDSTGSALVYSTYLGGTGADYINGLAVAGPRAAAVAGYTSSSNFPLVDAVQSIKSGAYEGFIARLSPSGGALEMGTYWGEATARPSTRWPLTAPATSGWPVTHCR